MSGTARIGSPLRVSCPLNVDVDVRIVITRVQWLRFNTRVRIDHGNISLDTGCQVIYVIHRERGTIEEKVKECLQGHRE